VGGDIRRFHTAKAGLDLEPSFSIARAGARSKNPVYLGGLSMKVCAEPVFWSNWSALTNFSGQ
jgi:hypothetical protein